MHREGTVLICIALKADRTSHGENVLAGSIEHRRWEAWDGVRRADTSASRDARVSRALRRDHRVEGSEAAATVAIAAVAATGGTADHEHIDAFVTVQIRFR